MAKHYIYTDTRKGNILFETVQPNYISIEDVDKMVLNKTGTDPRLNPINIERSIRVVADNFSISTKKVKKRG